MHLMTDCDGESREVGCDERLEPSKPRSLERSLTIGDILISITIGITSFSSSLVICSSFPTYGSYPHMSPVSNMINQPESPENKKRRISPVEEVPTPKQEEEQKWLLERTGLSTINDLTSLTKLNLPNCGLSNLPVNLPALLPNLSILFAPKNHFEELPPVIGKCSKLQVRKKSRDFLEASSPVPLALTYLLIDY
jgi:hypothetical protein